MRSPGSTLPAFYRKALSLAAVLLIAFLGFASFMPAAYATDSYNFTSLQTGSSSSSVTGFSTSSHSSGASDTVFVLYTDCLGSGAPAVSTVTDTQGNSWLKGIGVATPETNGGSTAYGQVEVWYATGSSGADTVTVAFASSCSSGYVYQWGWINSSPVTVSDSWGSGSAPSSLIGTCGACGNINGLNYPSKIMHMASSHSFVLAVTGVVGLLSTNSLSTNAYGTCQVSQTTNPLVSEGGRYGTCNVYSSNPPPFTGFNEYFQYYANAVSQAYGFSVTMGVGETLVSAMTVGWSVGVVVLSPTGVFPTNCNPSCQVVGGGTLQASGSMALDGNETYLYEGTSGPTGLLIQKVNVTVAAYTNGNAGKGTATFRLLLYTLQPGIMLSQYAVSSATPFTLVSSQAYSITTGSSSLKFQWNPSAAINGNTSYAVGIVVDYAGFSVQKAVYTTTLYNDTVDSLSSGVMPSLTDPVPLPTSTNVFLSWVATMAPQYTSISQITTTVTQGGGNGTVTVTQQGNPAILGNDNFMLAIIIILGPALTLAGVTKSLWGGFLGAVLGIAAGVYIGFVPFWTVALIALALVVMLFVMPKSTASGGGI
jgi:hypothetical protein